MLVALTTGPPAVAAAETGENVTVYRASNASFDSTGTIEAAIASGTVEPAGNVTVGDTLVVVIESERLADSMNDTSGSPTARFFTALDGDAEFRIIQTNPTANANRMVAPTGPANATVRRNASMVYVLVETADLTFKYRRVDRQTQLYGGERFAVQFGYDLPDDWSRGSVPDSPIIEFQQQSQPTTDEPRTTTTTTGVTTSSETTSARSPTGDDGATTTAVGERRTDTPGMPGFTAVSALAALLVLTGLRTWQ